MKYPRTASFPKVVLRRWRIRRALERNLAQAHENYQIVLRNPNKTQQALLLATFELQGCMWALEQHKSRAILWKTEKLALEVPNYQEKPTWWRDDSENGEEAVVRWLSERGRRGVSNLIRDERRKTWEWRIKVITPILAILLSMLGLIVALITVLTKLSESGSK